MKKIFALALLMCLFALPALAAEPVSYVECSWDETTDSVVKTVKQVTQYSNLVSSSNIDLTDGWYVVKGNVTVNGEIRVSGTVNLILTDGCVLTATQAIQANNGGKLNIYAQSDTPGEMGKLNAQKGIRVFAGRELYIHGGEVEATGLSDRSAGIGAKNARFAGVVTIYDGVVTATGGNRSAGIGGGNRNGGKDMGNGGTVTIYGGTVKATGGGSGAGIGGGSGKATVTNDNSGNGGTVNSHGGTVNIHGGTVTATGGNYGAGIGGGFRGDGADVTITGGSVKAIGGYKASAIGSGYNGSEGSLKNENGAGLTLYTLTIEGAAEGTPVQGLYGEGYAPYDYCANDMITQDTNNLYLYLPSDEARNIQFLSTAAGIYSVTWSGTNGTATLGEHTHKDDGAVTYELLTQARHVKLTACKDCPTAYVKRETEVHAHDRCDSDGATLIGLCACGYEIGKATVSAQGGVYNGGPYTAEVNKTGLFAGQEFAITYTRDDEAINETPVSVGSYTASITFDGAAASADFTIKELNITNHADVQVGAFAEMTYDGSQQTPEAEVKVSGLTVTGEWSAVANVRDETTFTADGNFTGTLTKNPGMKKANPTVTAPTENSLTYTGKPQELIAKGTTNGGTMHYSLNGTDFAAELPSGTDAGDYAVYYKSVGNDNFNDSAVSGPVKVTIARAQPELPERLSGVYNAKLSTVTLPEGWTWDAPDTVIEGESYAASYAGDKNHVPVSGVALKVAIGQSQTDLTAATDKTAYTYGEYVIVTVTPAATGVSAYGLRARFAAPAAGTVSLWNGETQLTEAKPAANGQEVTFDLPTVENGLTPGSYTLMAKYTESDNMAEQTAEVSFTVAYAETEKEAEESGEQLENGIYVEQPTLTAPEGTQISLDPAVWPEGDETGNSLTLPTQDGTHTYTYYVKLEDGTIAEKTVTLTVDTTAPEVEVPTVLADPTSAVITVTATDAVSGVMDIGFKVNSGEGELVIEGNGDGSYTITGLIPGETYSITLTVRDYMGHETRVDITITAPLPPVLPQTGDHSRAALWLSLLTMAGAGMMLLRRKAEQ